ncbi:RNA-directed DNA polymerase, eukaryota, reverse transcriptase zinc-binding domain protein, partial [Tanacetum coccineum]
VSGMFLAEVMLVGDGVPLLLDDIDDAILWCDRDGVLRPFSMACAWDTIRTRADIVNWLQQWDVGPSIDLNLLRCPLCDLVSDSHDHLFFECAFSSQVWSKVRVLCGMDSIPPRIIDVTTFTNPISKGKTVIVDVIISTVRLKLVTFKKMSNRSCLLLDQWKIPSSCFLRRQTHLDPWVNWKSVLSSKDNGGLGVSSLYALNRALLFKWIWRFHTQDSSLWVKVIKAIYGTDGNMDRLGNIGYKSCWLNIVQEVNILKTKGIDLRSHMCFKLGNGEKARFWDQRWLEGDVLKIRFPRVYALEQCKDITVGSKFKLHSLDYSFRRSPRGGVEQEQYQNLIMLMHDVRLLPMEDRWRWKLNGSGDFSVASVRRLIDDMLLPKDIKTRWVRYVPIKVNVIAWKVKSDSLPTRFSISRRGIPIESIKCAVCDTSVETSSHLFFSCYMVRQTVRLISRWWDLAYEEFESYEQWVTWLANVRLPLKNKLMLEGVFYVMWWFLWRFRNKVIFDKTIPVKRTFFDDIVSQSYFWCRSRCNVAFSLDDWLKNPNLISL